MGGRLTYCSSNSISSPHPPPLHTPITIHPGSVTLSGLTVDSEWTDTHLCEAAAQREREPMDRGCVEDCSNRLEHVHVPPGSRSVK